MIEEQTEETQPILIQYIKDRVMEKNKNFFMVFVGATGSGKTYSCLRLAEMLDPTFDSSRICFKTKQFMEQINKLVEAGQKGESIKGKVVVWDEVGVEHNARQFMSLSNKAINYFFQTSRHYNLIVIMTVPLLSFVDSATRKLMHAVAEMQGVNWRKKTSSVKVKMMQTNVLTGKTYLKHLRYRKDQHSLAAKRFVFGLPTEKLTREYETTKGAFTSQLFKDIMEQLARQERRIAGTSTTSKPITPFQMEIIECFKQGMTNQKQIGEKLGKSHQLISLNINSLRAKGVLLGNEQIMEIPL